LGNLTYTYDPATQRTKVGGSWARTLLPSAVGSATYDAANQQTAFGGQTQTYDLNGNLTGDGTNTYTWNVRNQRASTAGPTPASFVYDARGRRQRKTINGTITDFVYDGLNPVREATGATTINLLAGLGIDEYLTRATGGATEYFLSEALGSTVAFADGAGAVATEYTYQPFGTATATGTSTSNELGYTGREDDGTGVNYYRARYYHPGLQRFISEDPLRFVGGDPNFYAYVRNNPIAFVDPTGLCADPGGAGIRYCIDRFIPDRHKLGFFGDNRGPAATGDNTARMRISVSGGDVSCELGDTKPLIGPAKPGIPGGFGRGVIPLPLGGRKIRFDCEGWNGWTGPGLSPGPIVTSGAIIEDAQGNVTSVMLNGTPYPAAEAWQYGGSAGQPVSLGYYPASGASPWNLNTIGPIPLK
jgi:RHS repeat-associated protein